MTDLHCHLLHGIDDGAKDVDMALELLRQERNQGSTNIVFTSHFRPDHIELHQFLKQRNRAFGELMKAVEEEGSPFDFSYKLGAEVYFTPTLTELDLRSLCFTRSPYLLLEFSFYREPAFVDEVLFDLRAKGIIPVIAHVERYTWLYEKPETLYRWVESGIVLQANAGPLVEGGDTADYIRRLIDWNMVKLLASDTHHPVHRPVNLGSGLMYISQEMGKERARELLQNGNRVFRGETVIDQPPIYPKKRFGRWV